MPVLGAFATKSCKNSLSIFATCVFTFSTKLLRTSCYCDKYLVNHAGDARRNALTSDVERPVLWDFNRNWNVWTNFIGIVHCQILRKSVQRFWICFVLTDRLYKVTDSVFPFSLRRGLNILTYHFSLFVNTGTNLCACPMFSCLTVISRLHS
jgi:hypothetical protein